MKTTGTAYSVEDSDSRIQEILNASDQMFEELKYIPSSDKLSYTNGFYVNCTALFIDIRGSSKLPEKHNRPVLAKIYRSYLSECVAILNKEPNCREVFITGDCVSGIFDTPKTLDIESAVYCAGELNTLLNLLNWRLEQKGYAQIQCGIGLDYGRALMVKAGYRGSDINEIIWMGDVVNSASNLCHQGNKGARQPIHLSTTIKESITRADYLALLNPVYESSFFPTAPIGYEGNFVATAMNTWIEEQQQKKKSQDLNLAAILACINQPQGTGSTLLTSYTSPKRPSKIQWL